MGKKGIAVALLLGILFISPLVLAQEQIRVYSGFDRFIDNVKMFFTFGDNKVQFALEIREKEINSAIVNLKNGDDEKAEKNLERAKERLQFVQVKVSKDIADDVIMNVNETIDEITEDENLSDRLESYILEEEKTRLTAELVIEFEGKEGQTLTREVVKDVDTGKNKVKIVIDGENGQTVMEIEGEIVVLENKIAERIISNVVVEGGGSSGSGLLKPEVKTSVAGDGTDKNEPLPEPDLNQINPGLYDPNARAPGDTMGEPTNVIDIAP